MWEQFIEWDKKYNLHALFAQKDLITFPIERTEGNYIIDEKGNRILDMFAQLGCVNMGQNHPKIQSAIKDALGKFGFTWDFFLNQYKAEASKLIIEDLLGKDNWAGRVRFTSSGSEAVELALQISKLVTQRQNIITQEYGYHGWTEGAGSCTRMRHSRLMLSNNVTKEVRDVPGMPAAGYYVAPAPYCYRCPLSNTYPDCKKKGILACVRATEAIIKELGPETVAAMITEPEFGAGSIITPPEYNMQIREMTTKLNILWIDDEVFTGFGRTGKLFAYQHDLPHLTPDIMTMGKGLSSSALPVGGAVVSKKIAELFENFNWGFVSTFSGHPLVMAAVVANIKAMMEENILANVLDVGDYLGDGLKKLENQHKCVGLVDGKGLGWVVEIVKDKNTKEPFVIDDRQQTAIVDTSNYPTTIIQIKGLEKGVLWGIAMPNTMRIAPALTITKEEIDKALDSLDYALSAVDDMI
jgi:taurine--2-oxoglutarate transaminase